jgi:hypothetical protein
MSADAATAVFETSKYWPVAIGFFGLGTGYLVGGSEALFKFPPSTREVEKSMALWSFWMSGFMQFITGVILIVGLTWFGVFDNAAPLYMAALAFTAYGVHWFAVAHRRYVGASAVPEGWMAIAFLLLSILGVLVFYQAGDTPVSILFIGLSLVYITEIPTRLGGFPAGERLIGLWQVLTGLWLMYLTYGVVFNLALGRHWWV